MQFETMNDFSFVSKIGVFILDDNGKLVYQTEHYTQIAGVLDSVSELLDVRERCQASIIKASYETLRFRGRYIFADPRGFFFFVSPVYREAKKYLSVFGGPILMSSIEDYFEYELLPKIPTGDYHGLLEELSTIPVRDATSLLALSEQLHINAEYVSDGTRPEYFESIDESFSPNKQLSDYVNSFFNETEQDNGRRMLDEVQKLTQLLASINTNAAQILLRDIVDMMLFHPGKNLDAIRKQIVEIMTYLTAAMIRDGAQEEYIKDQKKELLPQVDALDNLQDIILWLNGFLSLYSGYVIKNPYSKRSDLVREAINYIQVNYSKRMTIEDAAAHIYIAPQYLSRLFKEETGYSFRDYLNRFRIERSKDFLHDSSISLADVSTLTGYSDQSYFTKVFMRYAKTSPNRYRNSIR
ncbi:MAG: helix-turn-helix domain-containing protein [Coriobacteriales bacterium]|jgi:AraC-like DNA-binding protein/ligand-binding sensor protein|nr:helix-turn-helix domain-containing protein [Coriobacteriales bacterium]